MDNPFLDAATRGGPIAVIFALILWGGFKRDPWWVYGWVFRDLLKRCDRQYEELERMRETATRVTEVAAKGATIAEAAVGRARDLRRGRE